MVCLSRIVQALALCLAGCASAIDFSVGPIPGTLTSTSLSVPMAGTAALANWAPTTIVTVYVTENPTSSAQLLNTPTITPAAFFTTSITSSIWTTITTSITVYVAGTPTSSPTLLSNTPTITPAAFFPNSTTLSTAPACFGPPTTYTATYRDTVSTIASKYTVSIPALVLANLGLPYGWDALREGALVNIPIPNCSYSSPTSAVPSISSLPPTSSLAPTYSHPLASFAGPLTTATVLGTQPSQPTPTVPLTAWTVESGDTGWAIASEVGVPFFAISSANPTVSWTALIIGQPLVIPPSPTALVEVTGPLADTTVVTTEGMTTPELMYKQYEGNGSIAAGWPGLGDWLSFDTAWNNLETYLGRNCGDGIPNNSDAETETVKSSILSVAAASYLDPRFILAVFMQERNGCIHRVIGTHSRNSTTGNPYSNSAINQMIARVAAAPIDGMTLVSALNQAAAMAGSEPAQAFYRAARFYNSGPHSLSPAANGDLGSPDQAGSRCFASDIANRLLGWSNGKTGTSPCALDEAT